MHSVLYMRSIFKKPQQKQRFEKQDLNLTWEEVRMPLLFLLSLSLLGLSFYPALLFIMLIMIHSWRHNRYDFLIMFTLFCGGYALISQIQLKINPYDIGLAVSAVLWIVYRKQKMLQKIFWYILAYFAVLLIFAFLSLESMSIQMLTLRKYMSVIYIIVPIAIFSGKKFDITEFFRKIIVYSLILSAYYVLDGFVFSGNILVPNTFLWFKGVSTFFSPVWMPLTGVMFRKYPHGLYLLMLAVYPIARYYKLRPWQWILVLLALAATQTFTIIFGFVVVYMLMQGKLKTLLKYAAIGVVAFVALYFIDGVLPVQKAEGKTNESTLRIKSSVDQVFDLFDAVDDEDLAMFASGRVAQIIPKAELVVKEHRQLQGLGFLHREKSHIQRYMIINDYYSDVTQNLEMATGVEVVPVQIWITIGWIGLLLHIMFFAVLYWIIRKFKYAPYAMSLLLLNVFFGLGGFAGLHGPEGLFLFSASYAAVLLANRWSIDSNYHQTEENEIIAQES